ncbi:MAG: histone H1 [Bacteroidota bacterium]
MNHYEKLKQLVLGMEDDFMKFYEKGNSAAGTRVRKGMQDLKVWAQEIRTDVQNIKNSSSNKG